MAHHKTKNVRIVLGALTRVEYTEVLAVPVNMTNTELDALVQQRYDDVDSDKYYDDPDFWEQGDSCTHQPASNDDKAERRIRRIRGGNFEVIDREPTQNEAPKAKFYIGRLKETNGEHGYDHQFRFTTADDPSEYMDSVASRFYDDDGGRKAGDGYYFNDGALFVEAKSCTEVDAKTYAKVAPFIPQL